MGEVSASCSQERFVLIEIKWLIFLGEITVAQF